MKKLNTDKVLFLLLFVTLSLVFISQIGLVFPKTRDVFTNIESLEGTNYKDGDVIKGTVTLVLADGEAGNNLEIMVNGEKIDVFDKTEKEVVVLETSVIEIYAYDLKRQVCVEVKNHSKNLTDTTKNTQIVINNGYNMVGRYLLEG